MLSRAALALTLAPQRIFLLLGNSEILFGNFLDGTCSTMNFAKAYPIKERIVMLLMTRKTYGTQSKDLKRIDS